MISQDEAPDDGCEEVNLLTANGLAKRLHVSLRQVYRLDKSGSVPAPLRIGGCVRWHPDEIDRWLKCGALPREQWEKQRNADLGPIVETS